MTLKIETDSDGPKKIIRLSGRLRSEHLDELKTQMDGDPSRMVLDLDGVTLVDGRAISKHLKKAVRNCSIAVPTYESGSSVKGTEKHKVQLTRSRSQRLPED
jgi:hypothetical protein